MNDRIFGATIAHGLPLNNSSLNHALDLSHGKLTYRVLRSYVTYQVGSEVYRVI